MAFFYKQSPRQTRVSQKEDFDDIAILRAGQFSWHVINSFTRQLISQMLIISGDQIAIFVDYVDTTPAMNSRFENSIARKQEL
jgi:hypothetical protein